MVNEPVDLRDVRQTLMGGGLEEATAPAEPMGLFSEWLDYAVSLGLHNANAMAIATADRSGRPSVRNVLLRGSFDEGLAFYTNYESQKGRELAANPVAEALFSWLPLERQVRLSGAVRLASPEQSDAYFASRARESRISAMASDQSRPVDSRADLERRHQEIEAELGAADPVRPSHWGGFVLEPDHVEFWQGRPHRLHDRLVYTRREGGWDRVRLQP